MLEHHLLEPLLDGVSEDTIRSSETSADKCERTMPAPESRFGNNCEVTASAGATVEDTTLDGIPKEVIEVIGAYDTDCAGGCG